MPKRPVAAHSDSESESEPASPKRTRTQRDNDNNGAGPSRPARRAQVVDDNDSDDEEIVIPVEVDDEEFERANSDKVRESIESSKKVVKGIAEYGIIQAIEMENFMCHERLSFEFGEQINFIIGHNGSGKSAVLSALTIALGGKTNSTGRGTGLKSFIREGQHSARITLRIKNEGPEAYRPEEYGKSIVIERRFTKEGASNWKLMDSTGKHIVSTKREELSAICDHMNVQVDNPMNVLTQDAARQFLSASRAEDKYKFFLLGTQLFQLSTEYDTCLDNIRATAKLLATKKEAIPDLRRAYNEALKKYKDAEKAREQKKKADILKKELAWAHVHKKGEEFQDKLADVEEKKSKIGRIEEELRKAQVAVEEKEAAFAACEAEVQNLGSVEHLSDRKKALSKEIKDHEKKIGNFNADITKIEGTLEAVNQSIQELEQTIETERLKVEANSQAKRDALDAKIQQARAKLDDLEARQNVSRERQRELSALIDASKTAGQGAEKDAGKLQERIMDANKRKENAQKAIMDQYVPYGHNIRGVLEEIDRARWIGEKPIGPLGKFVKAREPEKWGNILRSQLGNILTAFAVTNAADREQLKRILMKSNNGHCNIIISERDIFDYSIGEPPAQYHTVLRALEITDEWVVRLLINQNSIERTVLSAKRKSLEEDLTQLGGGFGWSLDGFGVRVYPEGGVQSSGLNLRRGGTAQDLLLTGRDSQAEIRHCDEELAGLHAQMRELTQTIDRHKAEYHSKRKELDAVMREDKALYDAHRKAKVHLNELQSEMNDEVPADSVGMMNAKIEAEGERTNYEKQRKIVIENKEKVVESLKQVKAQFEEVNGQLRDFYERQAELNKKMGQEAADRLQLQSNIKHWENKLRSQQEAVEKAEENARVTQEEFKDWTKAALDFCEEVPTTRDPALIESEMKGVNRALEAREKRAGESVEEMAAKVNKAKDAMEKVENEWKNMNMLNKTLKQSMLLRLHRWQEFRRHIALRCKLIFAFNLSHRGYFGKVMFNHDAQTLTLRVQTDDQAQNKGANTEKDPKSLSGGEKSFSTICLLLSLWDSIGCPLRCLDEFDVFMDAVNRRISMKMMIDTATANPDKQYILITPQDMTNIKIEKNVRVHRMLDPVRRATLNMASA